MACPVLLATMGTGSWTSDVAAAGVARIIESSQSSTPEAWVLSGRPAAGCTVGGESAKRACSASLCRWLNAEIRLHRGKRAECGLCQADKCPG